MNIFLECLAIIITTIFFIKLSIKVGELFSDVREERFSYGLTNLLSDLGGILGFYVGVSVLTLFELFNVFLYPIEFGWRSRRKEKQNAKKMAELEAEKLEQNEEIDV